MDKDVLLRLGENVMPKAPTVQLNNGKYCIPQHYLTYQHTLQSVEELICDIEYDPRYVVFADKGRMGFIYKWVSLAMTIIKSSLQQVA